MKPATAVIESLAIAICLSAGCTGENDRPTKVQGDSMTQFKNPTEAQVPEFTRLVHSGDENARKDAALALGTIGSSACIDPVLAALADDDDYMRSYAMIGIRRGIVAKRCSREFLDAVFPSLVKLLNREDKSVSGEAPLLLLAIDSARAIPILLSPEYITAGNRQLHYILKALNLNGISIPHHKLLPLLTDLKPKADKYPHDYDYSESLIAYGRNPDDRADALLRNELTSANKKTAAGASQGLAILHGVENPYRYVAEIVERTGFATLTDPQKHYYAVSIYGWQVDNGGHAQYFFNASGDSWKSALSGLKAIGAKKRAAVLEEAASKFSPNGPSEDRVTRVNELRRLPGDPKKAFEELDSRFYEAGEDFDVLLPLYAIDNKSEFTRRIAPQ